MTENKRKYKGRRRMNKEYYEEQLSGICPEYYERAKRRLREGKPINPLWWCYVNDRLITEWDQTD